MEHFRTLRLVTAPPRGWASALVVALLLSAILIPQTARAADPEEGDRYERLIKVETTGGVVVSESAQASQAGLDVLNAGGNAIDAAIATTFAIGVTRPEMCGIGGGGFLTYRGANGAIAALDFRETAPADVQQNTFNQDSEGGGTGDVKPGIHSEGSGHTVVGVPGVVAGMDEALDVLGSGEFTLAKLIAPAERYAREGIRVTHAGQLYFFLDQVLLARLANYPETARVYGGAWIHGPAGFWEIDQARAALGIPGHIESPTGPFKQEDYAKGLRLIMKYGPDAFYQSKDYEEGPSIAKLIAEDMAEAEANAMLNPVLLAKTNGNPNDIGLMVEKDLASYEAKWRTPLVGHYRDHQVITMPPPAGGMVAVEIMNLLENFNLASFGHSSADHLHALAETQKLAWGDRIAYLADPDFEMVPTDVLTNKGYANQRISEIDMGKAKSVAEYGHATLKPPYESTHTTHLSVIDRQGNAVAVTCSLGTPFGSGVVAPGAGFFLNNQLTDFDWTWADGSPAPANAPEGGKRPRSAMSPTIVVRAGQPVLVTGGAGGPSIILGVVQNILNVVDFDLDVFHAIDAPRIDSVAANLWWLTSGQSGPECDNDLLAVEHTRIDDSVEALLVTRGHELCRVGSDGYAAIPIIQSAGIDLPTGNRLAISDPRGLAGSARSNQDQGPVGQ